MASSNRGAKRTNAGVPPSPKEMQDAYEIRAALEEVGGRAAARALKGNTITLQRELEAMREAFARLDASERRQWVLVPNLVAIGRRP